MQAAVISLVLAAVGVGTPPVQVGVQVALGPKAYRDGDVIEITDVTATSAKLEQGDSVTVKGRVRLASRQSAQLGLYLTQTEGSGAEETDRGQWRIVSKGLAEFELKTTIKHRGYLHVTLYDAATSKPFGGVYFGTPEQMERIGDWKVDYYLGD
jgi:hypothetical protein